MKSVFLRNVDVQSLKDKPIADYTTDELLAYLMHNYPGDPMGKLLDLTANKDIGFVVSKQAKIVLEGFLHDKRNKIH